MKTEAERAAELCAAPNIQLWIEVREDMRWSGLATTLPVLRAQMLKRMPPEWAHPIACFYYAQYELWKQRDKIAKTEAGARTNYTESVYLALFIIACREAGKAK